MLKKFTPYIVALIAFLVFPVFAHADGHFTASNVHYNPVTSEVTFDGTGVTPSATWYDSIGISSCNNSNICADDSGEYWGPSTYFTNYQQFSLSDPQHFDTTLFFNTYRPSGGTVYVWVKTNSLDRNYSQALDYNTIIANTPNTPPQVNTFSGATINEGGIYTANGSFTDTDSTSWTATVDYGDGGGAQPLTLSGMNFSLSHQYKDEGTYFVTISVTDNQGATGSAIVQVTVNNVAPTVGTITVATSPVQVNSSITASASFTDPGVLDTHTASWNWGDGNTTTGTVTESNGSGSVSNTHTYTAAGVYPVTLTVTDNNNASGTATYQYVVVYDASAGWVNGNKEFTSPASAVTGNTSATGKASFGFQVKYTNGSMVPSGKNVSLSFPTGNIDFASTSYQWLVVSGSKATFKANGTLNGTSGYTVLVSAIDNGNGNATDYVRFQIKNSSGTVVYDTQPGAADTANPTTAVTKGKITVH